MDILSTFSSFFKQGGPFMYIILGAAVLIVAIAAERFWVIARASALNNRKLRNDLLAHIGRGDRHAAVDLCRKVKSPAAQVALTVLETPDNSRDALLDSAEGEASIVIPPLTRRLPHLSMLSNVATLLGLLGTIFGLTTAFAAVGAADPSQRSAFLAAGISQALNTTAFGLIVAVPTLLLHSFLVSKVERIIEQIDEMSVRLIQALAASPQGVSREAAPAVTNRTTSEAPVLSPADEAARRKFQEDVQVVLR